MKKIFWFLVSFAIAAGLGAVLHNTWKTTEYFQSQGREATLKVGKKYNASRWSSPIPLKQIHAYTATLLPDHEVLIESDQDLAEGKEYFVRFLTRDVAAEGRALSRRALVNTIRLKSEADGTPVKLADTDLMDRAVAKAMGPPAEGVYVAPRAVAEAAPDHAKPTVPFLIAGAKSPAWEIIWNNSTTGEVIVAVAWGFVAAFFFLHALSTPLLPGRGNLSERKDFVHPSQRRIDPDAPDAPSAKIKYKPSPANSHLVDAPPPKPAAIPLPPGAKIAEPKTKDADDSRAVTAPPFVAPTSGNEPSLKLKRKSASAGDSAPTPPPAQSGNPPPQA
jgi:hypothetical protein